MANETSDATQILADLRNAAARPDQPPHSWYIVDTESLEVATVKTTEVTCAVPVYDDERGTALGGDHEFSKLIDRSLHGRDVTPTERDLWVRKRLGDLTGVLGGNGWGGFAPWVIVVAQIIWQSFISNAPWDICKTAVMTFLRRERKQGRGPGWQDIPSDRVMLRTVERIACQEGLEEFYVQMEYEFRQGVLGPRAKKTIKAKGRRPDQRKKQQQKRSR